MPALPLNFHELAAHCEVTVKGAGDVHVTARHALALLADGRAVIGLAGALSALIALWSVRTGWLPRHRRRDASWRGRAIQAGGETGRERLLVLPSPSAERERAA